MSDVVSGRLPATPAVSEQPLPAVETGRPVADRETTRETCEHLRIGQVRWDIKPHSVLVDCADCGAEAFVELDWDDRAWGDD